MTVLPDRERTRPTPSPRMAAENGEGGGMSGTTRPAAPRPLGWAAPALAVLIVTQILAGGANQAVSSAIAAFADALLAIAVIALSPAASRFWRLARLPLALLAAALLWAALPGLLPRGAGEALAMPANPAADLFGLALAKALATTLLTIVAALLAYRAGSARGVVRVLTLAGLVYVAWAAVDAVDWLYDSARAARYSGTIGNPNAAGIVFAAIALLAGGLALAPDDEPMALRLAALAGSAVALVLCALTGSRSAVLLALLGGALLLVRRWRRWQDGRPSLRLLGPAALAMLVLLVLVAVLTPVADRSAYLPEDAGSRWAVIDHYAGVANASPLWGHGLGSFYEVNQHTLTAEVAPLYWNFGAAHNAPVQLAIEAGWPGLALLLIALAAIAFQIARARRDWWSVAPLCALAAITGSAMVDIALNVPAVAGLFAILLGSVWGAALASGAATRRSWTARSSHRRQPSRA